MLIFPAIDLSGSNVVGMYRGAYDSMKVYSNNVMDIINDITDKGAECVHITDIESARTGTLNTVIVKKIKETTSLYVQIGGGIRNMGSVERFIEAGADRIVIGNAALRNEAFVKQAVSEYKERIAISIDIKDGLLMLQRRVDKDAPKALDYALKLQDMGAKTILCTDVNNAGNLCGIDTDLFGTLNDALEINVIASGGIKSLEDILMLQSTGIYGAIIGRAYYDGAIYLKEAVRLSNS